MHEQPHSDPRIACAVVDIAAENLRHLQAGETLRCWIEH